MESTTVFLAARTITSAKGIVSQAVALFNVLATADLLGGTRPGRRGEQVATSPGGYRWLSTPTEQAICRPPCGRLHAVPPGARTRVLGH